MKTSSHRTKNSSHHELSDFRKVGALTRRGRYFVDATYEGDLVATAGVAFHVGREGQDEYGESLAPPQADGRLQGYNFRLTMNNVGMLYFLQNDAAVPKTFRDDARSWNLCRDELTHSGHLPELRPCQRDIHRYMPRLRTNCMAARGD